MEKQRIINLLKDFIEWFVSIMLELASSIHVVFEVKHLFATTPSPYGMH
jgi:hypothetical protein